MAAASEDSATSAQRESALAENAATKGGGEPSEKLNHEPVDKADEGPDDTGGESNISLPGLTGGIKGVSVDSRSAELSHELVNSTIKESSPHASAKESQENRMTGKKSGVEGINVNSNSGRPSKGGKPTPLSRRNRAHSFQRDAESSSGVLIAGKGSLWQQILSDARSKTAVKPDGHIILLGSQDVGKSTLVRQLQIMGCNWNMTAAEQHHNTGGVCQVDYAYINARNLYEEDLATVDPDSRVNVWMLQDASGWKTLAASLPKSCVEKLAVMICLDMKQAWSALNHLKKWFRIADNIVEELLTEQDDNTQEEIRTEARRYLGTYKKHVLFHSTTRTQTIVDFQHMATSFYQDEVDSGSVNCPIPVPIIVVVTRSDCYPQLDTKQNQGAYDVMLAYLRHECLKYSAALVFTSCKDEKNPKNVLLLYRYLMHRIYGYQFREPADLELKDEVFIPSGWDTETDTQAYVARTVAGSFEQPYEAFVRRIVDEKKFDDQASDVVPVQNMDEFIQQLQQQHPSAVISSRPTEALGAVLSQGTKVKRRQSSFKDSDVQRDPSARGMNVSIMTPRTTGSRGSRSSKEFLRGSKDVEVRSGSTAGSRTMEGATEAGDPATLQNFFQGLIAKNRNKPPANPRERSRAAPRPPGPPAGSGASGSS